MNTEITFSQAAPASCDASAGRDATFGWTTEFVPMEFQGTPEGVAAMFEGCVIPKVGDVIGGMWSCYEITAHDGQVSVKCRYRLQPAA